MTTHARHDRKLVRTVVLGAAFVMATIGAGGQIAAQALIPSVHMGGSGGGGSSAIVDTDWAPTANERSLALTESKEAPGGILAGIPAPPARVAYEDSEHAVAQNRGSVASQAPERTSPHQGAY